MRRLLEENTRAGSLFGAHRELAQVREDVDLIAPALDVEPDGSVLRASAEARPAVPVRGRGMKPSHLSRRPPPRGSAR